MEQTPGETGEPVRRRSGGSALSPPTPPLSWARSTWVLVKLPRLLLWFLPTRFLAAGGRGGGVFWSLDPRSGSRPASAAPSAAPSAQIRTAVALVSCRFSPLQDCNSTAALLALKLPGIFHNWAGRRKLGKFVKRWWPDTGPLESPALPVGWQSTWTPVERPVRSWQPEPTCNFRYLLPPDPP